MSRRFVIICVVLVTAGVLLVGAWAVTGESKDGPAPNGATLSGVDHGDEVTSPFTVEMEADDIDIVPSGGPRPGEGHFHILVDIPCVLGGEVIPEGPGYLHFDGGETSAELTLEPGTHDLCLQVADGAHVAFTPSEPGPSAAKTHEIEITVKD